MTICLSILNVHAAFKPKNNLLTPVKSIAQYTTTLTYGVPGLPFAVTGGCSAPGAVAANPDGSDRNGEGRLS